MLEISKIYKRGEHSVVEFRGAKRSIILPYSPDTDMIESWARELAQGVFKDVMFGGKVA